MKIMFAVSLVSFICLTENLSKAEIIVDPSGNGDYTTIQEALNGASQYDVIRIKSGTYQESVTVNKSDITLEAYDSQNPPVLEGGRTLSGSIWTSEGNYIYSTNFTWSRSQPSDDQFTTFGGGKNGKSALQVYQDGVMLRGYRNRHDLRYWDDDPPIPSSAYITSGYSGGYRTNSDLDPANDIYGLYPPSYLKQEIRIEGRFRYDQANGKLYVRTPDSMPENRFC